jgi:hypothetical protein
VTRRPLQLWSREFLACFSSSLGQGSGIFRADKRARPWRTCLLQLWTSHIRETLRVWFPERSKAWSYLLLGRLVDQVTHAGCTWVMLCSPRGGRQLAPLHATRCDEVVSKRYISPRVCHIRDRRYTSMINGQASRKSCFWTSCV